VTKNTAWLVVGAEPGANKLAQAEKYKTPKISEQQLLDLLGGKDI